MYYVLKNKIPVKVEMLEWAHLMEEGDRIVKQEYVLDIFVSTVFLGLDHRFWHEGVLPPILFETMIFGGKYNQEYQERYCTWEEAEAGHLVAVALAKKSITLWYKIKYLFKEQWKKIKKDWKDFVASLKERATKN